MSRGTSSRSSKKKKLFAKNRTKLTVILEQPETDIIDRLSERMEPQTKAETIRRAISVLAELVDEHDKGSVFGVKRNGSSAYKKIDIIR